MDRILEMGEPAPWFHARALDGNERYTFDVSAGRWMLILLMGSGASPASAAALDVVARNRDLFDDRTALFFGVTTDPEDVEQKRVARQLPGIRWFLDYDREISRKFGAVRGEAEYKPHWLMLDPMMRVVARADIADGDRVVAALRRLTGQAPLPIPAPVLVIPNILSRNACNNLIGLYEQHGGKTSGFMREQNGITALTHDPNHKVRADYNIKDQALIDGLKVRVARTIFPMIERAFNFQVTRIERFIVACYDAKDGGHFRAHRDNTTKGTAHRRFACTINLNDGYDGGDLCFPEFGQQTYRAPPGGAVVFSCALLHEARKITRGTRYAFLPFLYDDDAAKIREANQGFLTENLQGYQADRPAA